MFNTGKTNIILDTVLVERFGYRGRQEAFAVLVRQNCNPNSISVKTVAVSYSSFFVTSKQSVKTLQCHSFIHNVLNTCSLLTSLLGVGWLEELKSALLKAAWHQKSGSAREAGFGFCCPVALIAMDCPAVLLKEVCETRLSLVICSEFCTIFTW